VFESGRLWLVTAPAIHELAVRSLDPDTGLFTIVRSFMDLPVRWVLDGPAAPIPSLAADPSALWVGTDESGEIIRIPVPGLPATPRN
jgi:hypothetical protein